MESLIFLTEKPNGIIKGRPYANGRIHKDWMNKEELSIPKVALELVIFTTVIHSNEVAIVDIKNAFIQTKNPKKVGYQRDIMKIRVKLAQILVDIA